MKPGDINVGCHYKGRTGKVRKVVSCGGSVYGTQLDVDTINYQRSGHPEDRLKNMTRRAFAAWAISEV